MTSRTRPGSGAWRPKSLAPRSFPTAAILAVVACGDTDPPAGDGGTAGAICDTDPPITSGGDWGVPFDESADGTTGEDVVYEPPPIAAGDPTQWEYHSTSQTYYRGPTRDEIDDNLWPEATLLVIPPDAQVSRFKAGTSPIALAIPLAKYPGNRQASLEFETLALTRAQTHSSLSFSRGFIKTTGVVSNTTITPDIHFYMSTGLAWEDFGDTAVRVFSTSVGGIELNGAKRNDRQFRLHGPYDASSGAYTLDIAPPGSLSNDHYWLLRTGFTPPPIGMLARDGGEVGRIAGLQFGGGPDGLVSEPEVQRAATVTAQCEDDLDNDADSLGDACDYACVVHPDFGGNDFDYTVEYEHTKNFAMIGDGPFCTRNSMNWLALMADIGMGSAQMLNWLEPPTGQPRVPPVRFAWGGCTEFPTYSDAIDCHDDDSLCTNAAAYPFAGIGTDFGPSGGSTAEGYTGNVWEALDARAAVTAASSLHPTSMVLAVADRPPLFSNIVGIAYFPGTCQTNPAMFGAAVMLAPDGLDVADNEMGIATAGLRGAHEMGHVLGLWHDITSGSFMGVNGGTLPVVDWDADSLVPIFGTNCNVIGHEDQEFAWTQYAPSKFNPRSSGFGYTGCTAPAQCNTTAFPVALNCVAGQCVP